MLLLLVPFILIYGRRKSRQVCYALVNHRKVACVCDVAFEQYRIYVLANMGCEVAKSILVGFRQFKIPPITYFPPFAKY